MPNRIIKESIRTSKSVNSLSDFNFRTWLYLITYVDDYGCGSADPEILKGFVFPRRKGVTENQIQKALADLAMQGMIVLYERDGEPYFAFPNWRDHQRIQAKKHKFPEPTEDELRKVTVSHGESPSESNPIQSNPNTNPNPNPYYSAEQTDVGSPQVVSLTLNDGSDYGITQDQIDKWVPLYPAVDVIQELRAMKGWLDSNPKKRKTKTGILRFVNGWLSRAQDKPHFDRQPHKKVDTKFHNFEQRDDDLDDYAFKKMMAELGKT